MAGVASPSSAYRSRPAPDSRTWTCHRPSPSGPPPAACRGSIVTVPVTRGRTSMVPSAPRSSSRTRDVRCGRTHTCAVSVWRSSTSTLKVFNSRVTSTGSSTMPSVRYGARKCRSPSRESTSPEPSGLSSKRVVNATLSRSRFQVADSAVHRALRSVWRRVNSASSSGRFCRSSVERTRRSGARPSCIASVTNSSASSRTASNGSLSNRGSMRAPRAGTPSLDSISTR